MKLLKHISILADCGVPCTRLILACMQALHVFIAEFEIEYVCVLLDPTESDGFGKYDEPLNKVSRARTVPMKCFYLLQTPAEQNLCSCFTMLLCQRQKQRIIVFRCPNQGGVCLQELTRSATLFTVYFG